MIRLATDRGQKKLTLEIENGSSLPFKTLSARTLSARTRAATAEGFGVAWISFREMRPDEFSNRTFVGAGWADTAKKAATSGLLVQSSSRVGIPWCCATASKSKSGISGLMPNSGTRLRKSSNTACSWTRLYVFFRPTDGMSAKPVSPNPRKTHRESLCASVHARKRFQCSIEWRRDSNAFDCGANR